MPSFTWQGHAVHYRQAGEPGRPLLLILPGSTASSASHLGDLKHFGRSHHVAALDYLGTGGSDRLEHWPLDWWESGAAQATALAAHLGAGRFALLGCSGGGVLALLAAANQPGAVGAVIADSCPEYLEPADLRRIVGRRLPGAATRVTADAEEAGEGTSGTAGIAEQPFPGSLVEWVWREGPRRLRRLVAPPQRDFWRQAHGGDWADVIAADSALLLELAERGGWQPLAGRLGDLRCPVLLTSSLGDEELPSVVPGHQRMALGIADCRLWVTPRGGHPAMWTDKRGFRRRADRFLAEL
jgi:valacyclovir hydrolase